MKNVKSIIIVAILATFLVNCIKDKEKEIYSNSFFNTEYLNTQDYYRIIMSHYQTLLEIHDKEHADEWLSNYGMGCPDNCNYTVHNCVINDGIYYEISPWFSYKDSINSQPIRCDTCKLNYNEINVEYITIENLETGYKHKFSDFVVMNNLECFNDDDMFILIESEDIFNSYDVGNTDRIKTTVYYTLK